MQGYAPICSIADGDHQQQFYILMNNAKQLILNAGQRPTEIRVAVLGLLLRADDALSHAEVLQRLLSHGSFDRVTIYRALDWLTSQGLAHKVAGSGRAWRFQATRTETMHRHAHFLCGRCGKVICLPNVQPILPQQLPAGFIVESLELNIRGLCGDCG
jgi:Fur family ferric uptake transcriptional regulator